MNTTMHTHRQRLFTMMSTCDEKGTLSSSSSSASSSSSSARSGYLFFTNGPPLRVENGAKIELGGMAWQASFAATTTSINRSGTDDLVLSRVRSANNRGEQRQRSCSMLHNELLKRREDIDLLSADQASLLAKIEEVGAKARVEGRRGLRVCVSFAVAC